MSKAKLLFPAFLALMACDNPDKAVLFDGMRYGSRLTVEREDKRSFVATVSPVSQGLDGARQAAHFQGTTHCVRNYGTSDIEWVLSPEAEATALQIEDDKLTVQGRCAE